MGCGVAGLGWGGESTPVEMIGSPRVVRPAEVSNPSSPLVGSSPGEAEFPFQMLATRGLLNPIQDHYQTTPRGRTFIVSPTSISPFPHNIILHSII